MTGLVGSAVFGPMSTMVVDNSKCSSPTPSIAYATASDTPEILAVRSICLAPLSLLRFHRSAQRIEPSRILSTEICWPGSRRAQI